MPARPRPTSEEPRSEQQLFDLPDASASARNVVQLPGAIARRVLERARTSPPPDSPQPFLALEPIRPGGYRTESNISFFPFFSMQRGADFSVIKYQEKGLKLIVEPSKLGLPKMYDKGILITGFSHLRRGLDAKKPTSRNIVLRASELVRAIRGPSGSSKIGGSDYARIKQALDRLRGSTIYTNINTENSGSEAKFSLINEWKIHTYKAHGSEPRMDAIEISICDWLYRSVVMQKKLLPLPDAYFDLSPLERRLYEIAARLTYRRGDNGQPSTRDVSKPITMSELLVITGSAAKNKSDFRAAIEEVAASGRLPHFKIRTHDPEKNPSLASLSLGVKRRGTVNDRLSILFEPTADSLTSGDTAEFFMPEDL